MPSTEPFRVYSRCRPLNENQIAVGASKKCVELIDQKTLCIVNHPDTKQHIFQFDRIFNDSTCNQEVFEEVVVPLIDNVMNGINSTVFAYGITGSGKSHTMFGQKENTSTSKYKQPGIIPRTLSHLARVLQEDGSVKIRLSYIEIYNQQVFDLFSINHTNLTISEDQNGVFVNDLNEIVIGSIEEAYQLIEQGNSRRIVAETKANQFSSRSHAIVGINVERVVDGEVYIGKLSLVDLAGSEKQTVHHNNEDKGIRTFEGSNINKSLLALGNCINMLSDKKCSANTSKNTFIPYRDSKLTRLLKDSLGGNTQTSMIACIPQSSIYSDETINTLKYACRATKIEKVIHQNIKDTRALDKYRKECETLKKQNQNLKLKLAKSLKTNSGSSKLNINGHTFEQLQEYLKELVNAVQNRCENNSDKEEEENIVKNIMNMVVVNEKKQTKNKKQSQYEKFRAMKSQNRGITKSIEPVNWAKNKKSTIENVSQVSVQNLGPKIMTNNYVSQPKSMIPSLEDFRKKHRQHHHIDQNSFKPLKTLVERINCVQLNPDQRTFTNNENRHLVSLQNILKLNQEMKTHFKQDYEEIQGQQICSQNFTDDEQEQVDLSDYDHNKYA